MIINENGKKEGWEYQATPNGISYGIGVFYENGVGTKISSNAGIQDFNDIEHAMYVLGIPSNINRLRDSTIGIFKDCTFDIEFLKRIMPYEHFTWKDKEPKQYTFIENYTF